MRQQRKSGNVDACVWFGLVLASSVSFAALPGGDNPGTILSASQVAVQSAPEGAAVSLETKIGQMLIVGFSGTVPEDAGVRQTRQRAEAGQLGGLVLHTYNVQSPEQLRALVAHIRTWRVPLPLLICIGQEGGAVQRLRSNQGFRTYPSAYATAALGVEAATQIYATLAAELAELGIDLNFGPVVDLHHPDSMAIGARGRSFAAEPQDVVQLASTFISTHRQVGVKTTLKHFVGHGAAVGDTHKGFADATDTYDSRALEPYSALIDGGLADTIMTAHLINRHLEPTGVPMTFSRYVLQNLLRNTLGFNGVVITDDLQMGALTQSYSLQEILENSLVAGHDLLLFSKNAAADGHSTPAFRDIKDLWEQALAAAQRALAEGTLTAAQLDASYERIYHLKVKQNF